MARPSKENIIEENLDKIKELAARGLTLRQIAKELNISKTTLYKYKAVNGQFPDNPEKDRKQEKIKAISERLAKSVEEGRKEAIETVENSMFKSANGFTRKITKYAKVKKVEYENGQKVREYEEMEPYEDEVYYSPNITAGIFLLKNWGKYMNEPRMFEIRQKELELKEKQSW